MMISKEQFYNAFKSTPITLLDKYWEHLLATMEKYEINNRFRISMFLAQIAHESGDFRYVEELASGDEYDTRTDLGNTPEKDGDGRRYKGRGFIQITGKANYRAVSKALGVDFIKEPEKLELPYYAAMSAGWFWYSRGLNKYADRGLFMTITRIINGGLNGYEDRIARFNRIYRAML